MRHPNHPGRYLHGGVVAVDGSSRPPVVGEIGGEGQIPNRFVESILHVGFHRAKVRNIWFVTILQKIKL